MSTTVLTSSRKLTQAIGHPHPLLSVLAWELRRVRASRLFWGQALGFFVLVLFVIWLGREPNTSTFQFSPSTPVIFIFVAGTSAWGLLNFLPTGLVLMLGLLLPFVTADGVTRDLQRRTHELLMTTALPTRAYVWGRYLMGLLMSLGLALLMLAAILGMGVLLHLTIPNYPAPELGNLLLLWVGMVMSATILLSSISFALGTLFPRLSTLIKIGILLVWFVGAIMLPAGLGDQTAPPAWYRAWDPTSAATARGMLLQYSTDFQTKTANPTNAVQFQQAMLAIENRLYDLGTWLAPHLILACLSLLLVLVAAFTFQRFRNAFGA